MKKALRRIENNYWYFVEGKKNYGKPYCVSGDLSGIRGYLSGITGDLSGISGDLSGIRGYLSGISGDLSGISGDLSGITGNIDHCEITDEERILGVKIDYLIEEK